MSDRDIKGLQQFLEKCLKKSVLDYTLSDLTRPGENYGSIMQSLDVTVAEANGRVSDDNKVTQKRPICFYMLKYSSSIAQGAPFGYQISDVQYFFGEPFSTVPNIRKRSSILFKHNFGC